jgi:threonine/homoserine/homoserine lactone efflux protein
MPPFINGILFGLIFIFSFGPGFFALVQASLQRGFIAGVLLALGILLCDSLYAAAIVLGFSSVLEDANIKFYAAIIGCVVLLVLGFYNLMKRPKIYEALNQNSNQRFLLSFVGKGFLINVFNPFIIVFWITIVSIVNTGFEYNQNQLVVFLIGMLATIFTLDVFKSLLAHKLRNWVNTRRVSYFNKVFGVVMILFSFRIIYFLFDNYF